MSAVDVNTVSFQIAAESSMGVLPGDPRWYELEPNDVTRYGAEVTTVARQPISKDRLARAAMATDLDSGVDMALDFTRATARRFLGPALRAASIGGSIFADASADGTGYVVASGGALAANTLVVGKGFTTTANNGLKVVTSGSTGTHINVSGNSTEAASEAANKTVEVAGFQGVTSDFALDSNKNLTSATTNFTTLPLQVGMWIYIGDTVAGGNFRFTNAANTGFARVDAIAANLLTLSYNNTMAAEAAGTLTVRIFYGHFFRNWAIDNANYSKVHYRVEAFYDNFSSGVDAFHYANGNLVNTMTIELPTADKMTSTVTMIGSDTPVPTTTRATDAATPTVSVLVEGYNSSSDVIRHAIYDDTETAVAAANIDATITLNNNSQAKKISGTYGAWRIMDGDFTAMADTNWVLEEPNVLSAIRNNTAMAYQLAVSNDDGGFMIDFPKVRLGDGKPAFERNDTVDAPIQIIAEKHTVLGYAVGVTVFPYLPV